MKRIFTLIASVILSSLSLSVCAGCPDKVIEINSKAEFDKIRKPAVVDFYATWCGPCRKIAPILETLAKEYAGKVYFYKVDVDVCGDLAAKYGISSIPAVAYFPVEGGYEMTVGSRPKAQFEAEINTILLGK